MRWLTAVDNVRTSVQGDRQIEKLGAESLNDLELGDAHSSNCCICYNYILIIT